MLKYITYILGTVVVPYGIGKIFKIEGNRNPLFNRTGEENYSLSKRIWEFCLKSPIEEELLFRLAPYLVCSYFLKNQERMLFNYSFLSSPGFGLVHLPPPEFGIIYQIYHFLYAASGGFILGKAFYEVTTKRGLWQGFAVSVLLHAFHNLMCEGLYYLERRKK